MAKRNRQDSPSNARPPRDDPPAGAAARWWARPAVVAGAIFAVLLAVYNLNGQFLYGNDAKPNVYLPAALLSGGAMSFTPSEYPFMFHWVYRGERAWESTTFDRWDRLVPGNPFTYRQLLEAGLLKLYEPKYYLVPSVRAPVDGNPIFVNTFGPGAGLTALPVFAVLHLVVEGDLREHPAAMWYGAKVASSLLVAGSAAFVFLTARAFVATAPAALIALAYGLGTGAWSTSSQTLWQHGPNEFFLALGAYFLVRSERGWKHAAACGGALSAAVACRPTSVVVAAAVGVYLFARPLAARLPWAAMWRTWRKTLLPYVLAALPIAVLLASYNAYYLGSPWEFGQAKTGHEVALSKTGSRDLWQTPLLTGAAGLMVSPSRGLLVFSPFMVFALAGLVVLWTRRRYAVLWPLAASMAVLLVIAFKWFDWWGGWCYGPRPIVDTMPFFALMLIPVIGWICRHKAALVVFLALAAWSAGVQALGVLTYDMFGWNKRAIAEVYVAGQSRPLIATNKRELEDLGRRYTILRVNEVGQDIDDPPNRHRLWSLSDNQILFYLENFDEARRVKAQYVDIWLKEPHR
jgi:hypothetical protein